jgi:hypothetical protein
MTTASHGSANIDRHPYRGRLAAGIALLTIAALPVLGLVWLVFDYATQEYIGKEVGVARFAIVVVAMVTLLLVSSGVALVRSGRSGRPISNIYLVGLGFLLLGVGGTYIVNHTVEGADVEVFYVLSWVVGTMAMAVGAFLPSFRRFTSKKGSGSPNAQ